MTRKLSWCYGGVLVLVAMALVKSNVGITSFAAFYLSLLIFYLAKKFQTSQKVFAPGHLLLFPLLFTGLTFCGYYFMYRGIHPLYVDQCLSMKGTYHNEGLPVWKNVIHLVQRYFVWEPARLGWVLIAFLFALFGFLGFQKRAVPPEEKWTVYPALGSLVLLGLFNSLDYLLIGAHPRFDFWLTPVLLLASAFCMEWGKTLLNRSGRLLATLLIFAAILVFPLLSIKRAFAARVPERYLNMERGRVYLVDEELSTIRAIKEGAHFLIQETHPHDTVLALPYEPLFAFLADRAHAVREFLIGSVPSYPNGWQEERMIQDLERLQTPFVVWSNRTNALGVQCGFRLAEYLRSHYERARHFGGEWHVKSPEKFYAIDVWKRRKVSENR